MTALYGGHPNLIIGFHATEKTVVDAVVAGKATLRPSDNPYDWLGPGIYFWEGSLQRAEKYSGVLKLRGMIKEPSVVGCVLDLGRCLDLNQTEGLQELADAHQILVSAARESGDKLPKNDRPNKNEDVMRRPLDCAVIKALHWRRNDEGLPAYDTIRATFEEGAALYPGATFRQLSHVQIAVLSPECIKGYFYPRAEGDD